MSNPNQVQANQEANRADRQARARNLIACVRRVGKAREYLGAANNDCPAFDFEGAFNNPKLVKSRGRRVSKAQVQAQAKESKAQAKDFFRKACAVCEFRRQGCGDKDFKESLFWQIYSEPEVRIRFYNRVKSPSFKNGEKTLPCAVATKPGRLKNSDWVE